MNDFDSIVKRFTDAMAKPPKTTSYDTSAKVVRIEDDVAWVHMDGGVDETPVAMTVNAEVGDTVQIRVGGGLAWITGNATAPPTDDKKAKEADKKAVAADKKAIEADRKAGEAGKVATNYITDTNSDGVFVHPEGDQNNGVQIQDTVEIIRGGDSVAEYGTTARIGKAASGHTEIGDSGMKVYGGSGSTTLLADIGYKDFGSGSSTHKGSYITLGSRTSGSTIGENSVAAGSDLTASGEGAHAEGVGCKATGNNSHAEGSGTEATASYTHSEGRKSKATGLYAHAEGFTTTASGEASHAGGDTSIASGDDSFAHGLGVKATGTGTTACGKYNVADSGDLLCVGNGSADNNRKDAFCITSSGNAILQGAFYAGDRGGAVTRKMFVVESHSLDNQTLNASSSGVFSFSVAKIGYTPIAVKAVMINNGSDPDGAASSACFAYSWGFNGNTFAIGIRNVATGTNAKIKIIVHVLYIADTAI